MMRLVFMGTPLFALPSLNKLFESEHEILAVVTRPDQPKGRGLRETSPAVKTFAEKKRLPVFQPEKLRDKLFIRQLLELKADLFVVVAFRILPREVHTIPPQGTIDLHPSLLPKYRGAAPINWAIINGESKTGVTVFSIGDKVDAGEILMQKSTAIQPEETAGELSDRLAEIGANLLLDTVDAIAQNRVTKYTQPEVQPTPAPKISREDARIDWQKTATQVKDFIRGMNPKPGAFSTIGGRIIKIHRALVVCTSIPEAKPGQLIRVDPREGIFICTGDGQLNLREVQLEGRKRMNSEEFLRGVRLKEGDLFI